MTILRAGWRVGALLGALMVAGGAFAATRVETIAQGLVNPRGIALAPNGWLYVAEAGSGGSGRCIPSPEQGQPPRCYGETGALTRIDPDGIAPPRRVVTGLPSMAAAGGFAATSGPVDVDFFGMQAYVVMGWGGDPAARAGVGPKSSLFGTLLRVLPGGHVWQVADIAGHEARDNPDGTDIDSNPYGVLALPGRQIVADAGGNSLVERSLSHAWFRPHRSTRTFAVLPRTAADLDAVATTVVEGPGGYIYAGELTGAPFFRGASTIYRIAPHGGDPEPYVSGLTAVVDMAFDRRGTLYIVEIASGLVPGPGADPGVGVGRLLRRKRNGPVEVVLDQGLVFPSGLAIAHDGTLYLTNYGVFPGGGEVLKVTID
ncbi:MAG: ScyD/ScyE family protein [Steroidobacteraceae bacterium]